jgi:hypothetical protein
MRNMPKSDPPSIGVNDRVTWYYHIEQRADRKVSLKLNA